MLPFVSCTSKPIAGSDSASFAAQRKDAAACSHFSWSSSSARRVASAQCCESSAFASLRAFRSVLFYT
jgi:hypothetical protein